MSIISGGAKIGDHSVKLHSGHWFAPVKPKTANEPPVLQDIKEDAHRLIKHAHAAAKEAVKDAVKDAANEVVEKAAKELATNIAAAADAAAANET